MAVNIRGWTFMHWWVRPVVRVWFNIYHKSVTYSGTEHIDWEKPIIFAPSHQNAFSDALCIMLPAQFTNNYFIYPLTRADVFGSSKWLDWLLTSFHMMPVYRPRDNVNLQQKNRSVFADCYDLLAKKRNLLIHPEGNCIPEKRVRRFKKGLARIALEAEEAHNFDLGVTVIPVGINYRQIIEARKGIHVRYGAPIAVTDFADGYKKHSASGITNLTRAVQIGVEEVTVNIPNKEQYRLFEQLMPLHRSLSPGFARKAEYRREDLEFDKRLEKKLRKAERRAPAELNELKEKTFALCTQLKQYRLKPDQPLTRAHSSSTLLAEGLGYLILLPVILYGWINNILPWYGMQKAADTIHDKQFRSSARLVAGLLLFPASYLLQFTVFAGISGSLALALGYVLSLPLAGLITLNAMELFSHWRQRVRLKLLPADKKKKLFDLIEEVIATIT